MTSDSQNDEEFGQGEKGFYEAKGCERFMIIMRKESRASLKSLAKQFQLTQGEAVEVMLENLDLAALGPKFRLRRESKLSGKNAESDLARKLMAMSPEKRAEIAAMIAAAQGED